MGIRGDSKVTVLYFSNWFHTHGRTSGFMLKILTICCRKYFNGSPQACQLLQGLKQRLEQVLQLQNSCLPPETLKPTNSSSSSCDTLLPQSPSTDLIGTSVVMLEVVTGSMLGVVSTTQQTKY